MTFLNTLPNKWISSILMISTTILSTGILVEYSEYFIYIFILQIVLWSLALFIGGLGRLGYFSTKIHYYLAAFGVVTMLGLIASFPILEYQKDLSMKRGQPLIQALDAYKAENNTYPKDHLLLSPKYIPTILQTSIGIFTKRNFKYYLRDGEYTLYFDWGLDAAGVYEFSSDERIWHYDD